MSNEAILSLDKSNFTIPYRDIASVSFDESKKWGMGPYPHDGKVFVTTKDGSKREFIILANQSGQSIARDVSQAAGC